MTPRILPLFLAAACGGQPDFGDSVDAIRAAGVLSFVNGPDATLEVLDEDVGLDARAARGIVRHVRGRDNRLGTRDDDPFDTLAELDAIPYVGQAAFDRLDAYVRAHFDPAIVIEGVGMTPGQAQAIVALANTASLETLDDDVGLDARAASRIVSARPIAGIEALAAVPYVGRNALTALRDYVASRPSGGPSILRLSAAVGSGYDAVDEGSADGVRAWYETDGAASCTLSVLSAAGDVIATREDVSTSGPTFFGAWNSADPSSPWCVTPPAPAVLCSDRPVSGCYVCYPSVEVRLECSAGGATTARTVHAELSRKAYVAERSSGQVALVDGTGARQVVAAGLGEMIGATVDRRGRLFVYRFGAKAVALVDPDRGSFRDIATGIDGHGLAADPRSDTLYLAGYQDGRVYRLREGASGWSVDTIASGLHLPVGVRLDGNRLYVTDREAENAPGSLWVKDLAGGSFTRLLSIPRGADLLDLEENGDLLIVSGFGDTVTRVALNPARIVRTYEGDFGYGILVDDSDNTALITSEESNAIVRLDLDGGTTTVVSSEANGPWQMAFR
jgi:hypothetical protein